MKVSNYLDLSPSCLQRVSADDTSRQKFNGSD